VQRAVSGRPRSLTTTQERQRFRDELKRPLETMDSEEPRNALGAQVPYPYLRARYLPQSITI
jgi:hypothetical protein